MHPLWNKVVAPLLEASGARRIVEIGALRGQTTQRLLDLVGPEGELHVIDPLPLFDPSEHEARARGRYHFYRDTSHNALPGLPAMDAALIDGDHNWYTVFNELRMLAEASQREGTPLPLLIMHDVGWPYGRRDLYYEPQRIPDDYRHPYAQRGVRRGRKQLADSGGINSTMNNALVEGGPKNGVKTALEDFTASYPRELQTFILPIHFGLAIVAETERLRRHEALRRQFARLREAPFLREMLTLAESLRLREVQWGQAAFLASQQRVQRLADAYLSLLNADLGDQLDRSALAATEACLETIRTEKVRGDLVDCSSRPDGTSIFLCGYVKAHEMPATQIWLNGTVNDLAAPLADVLRQIDLPEDRLRFFGGGAENRMTPAERANVALVRCGAAEDDVRALEQLYPRVTLGGFVVVEGYRDGRNDAVIDRFRRSRGISEPLEVGPSGACWRKLSHAPSAAVAS